MVIRPIVAALLVAASVSCSAVLPVRYEYDEDTYLVLDGSAILYVNASVAALAALRGAPLNVDPRGRLDRNDVRAFFESQVTHVESISTSRREGRRYVHVRIRTNDIRRLSDAPAFAWSRYSLTQEEGLAVFRQDVGPSVRHERPNVGWTGKELVAFRLHLPSRVAYHNGPSREIERGNIIRWEQLLTDRLAGRPVSIEVRMETQSILVQTLTLFALTAIAALGAMALAVWWVMHRK